MKKITEIIQITTVAIIATPIVSACHIAAYILSFSIFLDKPAPPEPKIAEYAIITKVDDGDTVSITFSKEYKIRLLDCWAPEITGKEKLEGIKSKDYLQSILKPGDKVIVEIPITEKFQDSISFGRILGRVWKDVDNDGEPDNISEVMVKNGFAKSKK